MNRRCLWAAALDLFLPESGCAICGGPLPAAGLPARSPAPPACIKCLRDVFQKAPDPMAYAQLTSPSRIHLDGAVAGGLYSGALERAVLRLKHIPDRRLVGLLGRLLAERLAETGLEYGWDGVVPVPLHPRRLAERGFNQAELLADALAAELGTTPLKGRCERVRPTPLQSSLGREERCLNVTGAFRATGQVPNPPAVGRRLLIVDDVLTTGATVGETARALRAAGGVRTRVWAVVVARAR